MRFGITPDGGSTVYSDKTIGSDGFVTVTLTKSGLTVNTDYTVTAEIKNYSGTRSSQIFSTSEAACSSANSPAEDLGELALAAGSSISSIGQLAATVADASCVDADGRSSAYFELTIATGEAGAVKIEASPASSSLSPQLLVRSGQSTYTGTPIFQDVRSNTVALAAGHPCRRDLHHPAPGRENAGSGVRELRRSLPIDGDPAAAQVDSCRVTGHGAKGGVGRGASGFE